MESSNSNRGDRQDEATEIRVARTADDSQPGDASSRNSAPWSPRPNRKIPGWVLVAALVIAGLAPLIAAFTPNSSTFIELQAEATGLHFRLDDSRGEPIQLTGSIGATSIGVTGLTKIEIQPEPNWIGLTKNLTNGIVQFRSKKSDPKSRAPLTLQSLSAAAKSLIVLDAADESSRVSISVRSERYQSLSLLCRGTIFVQVREMGSERPLFPEESIDCDRFTHIALTNRPVRLGRESDERLERSVDLDISVWNAPVDQSSASSFVAAIPPAQFRLQGLVRIDSLAFQDSIEKQGTNLLEYTTISFGSIYFEELSGREKKLRPNENLKFTSAVGILREVAFAKDGFRFYFSGNVRGMTSGPADREYSLMPTWLDYLWSNHAWQTTLGAIAWIITIVAGVVAIFSSEGYRGSFPWLFHNLRR